MILALLFGVLATQSGAQTPDGDEGVVVRFNGNVELGASDVEEFVFVVNGNADVAGTAGLVVVANGNATLSGATVGRLVVVNGKAILTGLTIISDDVELINSEISRTDEVVVRGEVLTGTGDRFGRGMLLFGILFGLGVAAAIIISGLIAAAVAPHGIRVAGAILTDEFGKTFIATLLLWIGMPIVAIAAFMTIVGIPIGIGIFGFLLPALAFLGYLIAGIRLGDYLLGLTRGSDEAWHPYFAAFIGLGVLLLLGWLPVLGAVVTPIAAMLGSGALALKAWRVAKVPGVNPAAFAPPEGSGALGIP